MNVLLISEHYYPKVGGTVSYVENTSVHLSKKGIQVYLLVPGIGKLGKITIEKHSEKNLTILNLGVTTQEPIKFNTSERMILCDWINHYIEELCNKYQIEVVHLLFGLFVAAALNTKALQKKGIKMFHTIHNIPPFECSNSWKGDHPFLYLKDNIRKIGVKFINKRRIQKNVFDVYITPSNSVKQTLCKYVAANKIHIINHGGAEYIPYHYYLNSTSNSLNLLTVGGLVPHKNQHLIPKIATYLIQQGIHFNWNIVGPIRNQRYYHSIRNEILTLGIADTVFLHTEVDDKKLEEFYRNTNLYIQLSSEEGFCMTVLDAISYGTPVLGTPAGAIPEMLELVNGTVIELQLDTLKPIIEHYIKIIEHLKIDKFLLAEFKATYTWENATKQLIEVYHGG